jgi:hypothetical protein
MRKDSNPGILLSLLLLIAGTYLLYESVTSTQWYMEIYLVAGATLSTLAVLTVPWPIHRDLSARWPGQRVRRHR